MTTFAIYSYLFAVATIYAALLAAFKHYWEPDLTWLEVIVGVMLCLLAPYLDQRWNGPLSSETYEQRVWVAFLVGGFPVVVWQLAKSIKARLQVERRILRTHGNTAHSAAALASERGKQPQTDD